MNNKTVKFLTDDNGNPSAMRLMCVSSLGCSMLFGISAVAMSIIGEGDARVGVELAAMFAGFPFLGKVGQKFGEHRENV